MAGYGVAAIEQSCKNDIAALRAIPMTPEIFRELRVRGPDQHWHRYVILPESIEALENEKNDDPEETGVTPIPS